MDLLEQSLRKAFINRKEIGSQYDPKLIINQPEKKEFLLNNLQDETEKCVSFIFSIAFVTQDGLNAIKTYLNDLNQRGVKGRLITSTYLQFNHPDVFESLMKIPNLEVRLSEKRGFHAKGYLFEHQDYHSFIIGSSNLTMSALKLNYEWNVRLTSYNHGEIIHQMKMHLEEQWEQAIPLTQEWVTEYRENYIVEEITDLSVINDPPLKENYIVPNRMQEAALSSLKALRESGEQRGLVISATGTGKTYLAAFDVLNARPNKMLFIVHREQILKDAMRSFQRVIGGSSGDYGILSGNRKDINAKYLFATIQTISKLEYHQLFEPDEFDYILIDEVHKAGANSYIKTINYFEPQFLLGVTATPERTDKINIYELFDYNIAYEIRLQEALEEDLLSPFHYFGVTDYEKDGEVISEVTDLKHLVLEDRVKFLIEKLDYYGVSHNKVRGLVFCSRKNEAELLAEQFNRLGIPSSHLTGDHSIEDREYEIQRLEAGEIEYIFTVDIFNEGIDIPMVNQVVMLRNTQSSIIFIQQMGRGLRKHKSKEFVTIVDFIGNYKNNYMIPMALSGDISGNKDNLRRDTFETSYITGLSSINFEQVAKERIFASIDQAKLDTIAELRKTYTKLKERLNRVPNLSDFKESNTLDPLIIMNRSDNYHDFLKKMKDSDQVLSDIDNKMLKFLSKEILPGKRQHEIVLMKALMESNSYMMTRVEIVQLFKQFNLDYSQRTVDSVIKTLSLDFYTGTLKMAYKGAELINIEGETIKFTQAFIEALKVDYFADHAKDVLKTAWLLSKEFDKSSPLTRYQKYYRRDTIRLLGWKEQIVDQNIGGYVRDDEEKIFVIFVTLDKGEDFQGAEIAYEDALLDESTMHWVSKAGRKLSSPEIQIMQNPKDWAIHVFVKKSDDEGLDFYYLGEVQPKVDTIHQLEKPTGDGKSKSVVEMELKFKEPIESRLFKYLR